MEVLPYSPFSGYVLSVIIVREEAGQLLSMRFYQLFLQILVNFLIPVPISLFPCPLRPVFLLRMSRRMLLFTHGNLPFCLTFQIGMCFFVSLFSTRRVAKIPYFNSL